MRDTIGTGAPTSLLLALGLMLGGLALGACGGGSTERAEPTWRPSQNVPGLAQHWWWEPVERACEEDRDCRSGEHCRNMRLGTCAGCPRGETAKVCVGPNGETRQARSPGEAASEAQSGQSGQSGTQGSR